MSFGYKWRSEEGNKLFAIKNVGETVCTSFVQQIATNFAVISNFIRLKYHWESKVLDPLICLSLRLKDYPWIFSLRLFSNRFGLMAEGKVSDLVWSVHVHKARKTGFSAFVTYSC